MEPQKHRQSFVEHYIEKQTAPGPHPWRARAEIVLCAAAFLALMAVQNRQAAAASSGDARIIGYIAGCAVTQMAVCGAIAQIQVLLSVYLTISAGREGYAAALALNLVESLMALHLVWRTRNTEGGMGVVVALSTIAVISIIHAFFERLRRECRETASQREIMAGLYQEVASAEAELSRQNAQLAACNRRMAQNEQRLIQLAYYDMLTGLPNRETLIHALDGLTADPGRATDGFYMVFFDLDNFKKVNDSMGHHRGDMLLGQMVTRLRGAAQADDMIARLSGDEFAMLIRRGLDDREVIAYIEGLRKALSMPFELDGGELTITASFGIARYPRDGDSTGEIMRCADTAMYRVKENGRNAVQMFTEQMRREAVQRQAFEKHLENAVRNNELFLLFQPQYDAKRAVLRGFEALVRWESPEMGLIGPDRFIPVAEKTTQIIPIGEWILETACAQFCSVQKQTGAQLILAVNLSATQIMEPSFFGMLTRTLAQTGFDPQALELEVSESIFLCSPDYVTNVLKRLKRLGVRVALDNFGTGYSSLTYLKKVPVDTLKIDKFLTDGESPTQKDGRIMGLLISLVHEMGLEIVGKSVESGQQADALRANNCDYLQGYWLGRPVPGRELPALIFRGGCCPVG